MEPGPLRSSEPGISWTRISGPDKARTWSKAAQPQVSRIDGEGGDEDAFTAGMRRISSLEPNPSTPSAGDWGKQKCYTVLCDSGLPEGLKVSALFAGHLSIYVSV